MLGAIRDSILPTYVKFTKFVKEEYAPKGRAEPGMWSLPDGEARYAFQVKQSTTSDLTPEEIHQLGLREVTRIEGEMLQVAKKLGYQDLKSLNAAIEKDPKLHAHSRQQILDLVGIDSIFVHHRQRQHLDASLTEEFEQAVITRRLDSHDIARFD